MKLLDSRRLTGPNLQLAGPAAIAEVELEDHESADVATSTWHDAVSQMLDAVGWSDATRFMRVFGDGRGAAIGFGAPADALYAATEVNEWAIATAAATLAGTEGPPFAEEARRISAAIAMERRPELLRLIDAAAVHGLPVLVDEDGITVGLGIASKTWPPDVVPSLDQVPFAELGTIPVVAVTGTNGKTTCTRWLSRIFRLAGQRCGHTSTDGIVVDDVLFEDGDCTGPGAARRLLRHQGLQAAVLETARGGLLRRGFVLDRCDGALITNVSDDHRGEFGIQSMEELAAVKAIVAGCVDPEGVVVLGADSEALAGRPWRFPAPQVWFAASGDNPRIAAQLAEGGEAWFVDAGVLVRARGKKREPIIAVADIALALDGRAAHNVANALGVAAIATGLGLPHDAIVRALREFGSDPADNPGRLERFDLDGVLVLLDFAHNIDGIRQQTDLVESLRRERGGRLLVSFGMAGDRSDTMLESLAAEIMRMKPDHVIVREQPDYLRGRVPGEVPAILHRAFSRLGVPPGALEQTDDERTAVAAARRWARTGDTIVILAHTVREPLW